MERQFPAGLMPDFRDHLPELLKRYFGQWVWHEPVSEGIIRHLAADGTECLTVRVQMPPNGLLSAQTLRLLARWTREYAQTGRRTSRQSFELVGVSQDRLHGLLDEIDDHGFTVGGTGRTLRQLMGCNGYVHCQNAAADAPSIMKAVGEDLYDDIATSRYPAPLRISVSGCPNQCGGGVTGDVGISGVFLDLPEVNDRELALSNPDFGLLARWCPHGAIKLKMVPEGRSVTINPDRCTRCSSCALVAPRGITMGPRRGVVISVAGRGPSGGRTPRLTRIAIEGLPSEPPGHRQIVARVRVIVEAWVSGARPGERIADWIDRIGWEAFQEQIGGHGDGQASPGDSGAPRSIG